MSKLSVGVKLAVSIAALLTMIFAVKPYYGGEVTIRLNEPASFSHTPSDYSNLVFYSLLYENLFYLGTNGEIFSNIFEYYKYDKTNRALVMDLKGNTSFSNGDPINGAAIKRSIDGFLEKTLDTAIKLRRIIRRVEIDGRRVTIHLMYDTPDITALLTAPELVLLSGSSSIFSGMFQPVEWERNRYITLAPNKYYPGGRTYLDGVKVIFYDYYY
ncbi:MAG: hypothetical protein GY950_28535, partial [bacterium]|nr:hypothetical protein [bacterium]